MADPNAAAQEEGGGPAAAALDAEVAVATPEEAAETPEPEPAKVEPQKASKGRSAVPGLVCSAPPHAPAEVAAVRGLQGRPPPRTLCCKPRSLPAFQQVVGGRRLPQQNDAAETHLTHTLAVLHVEHNNHERTFAPRQECMGRGVGMCVCVCVCTRVYASVYG